MTTIPLSKNDIDVKSIINAELTHDEIIQLVAFISSGESTELYSSLLHVLVDKYNTNIEMRSLEVEALSLRSIFNRQTLKKFYDGLEYIGYETLILDTILGYQDDKMAIIHVMALEEIFGYTPTEEFCNDVIRYIDESDMIGIGVLSVRRHFRNTLSRVSKYAPIPKYIEDFDIEINKLPNLQKKEPGEVPTNLVAEYLLTQVKSMNFVVSNNES